MPIKLAMDDGVKTKSSPTDIVFAVVCVSVTSDVETALAAPPSAVELILPVNVAVPLSQTVVTVLIVHAIGQLTISL